MMWERCQWHRRQRWQSQRWRRWHQWWWCCRCHLCHHQWRPQGGGGRRMTNLMSIISTLMTTIQQRWWDDDGRPAADRKIAIPHLSNATINYVLFLQLGEDMTRERGKCGGWDNRKESRWNWLSGDQLISTQSIPIRPLGQSVHVYWLAEWPDYLAPSTHPGAANAREPIPCASWE